MNEMLAELNESQRDAVLFNDGPSLVIAGAGSGKTRVLTYKIAYLIASGIYPGNILALTFTNKAAREMKSRIASIVGEDMSRMLWMGTFHSIFSRILRREAERIGYERDFTIYDSSDSKNLIKSIIKEMKLDDKYYKASSVQARISKVKNALITPEAYAQDKYLQEEDYEARKPAIKNIYQGYWDRCRSSGVMDFDDLLLQTYLLFKNFPDVVNKYRNYFRFILVDEYQDTNHVQHEIIRLLAEDHRRVCVVGDDAQSIYSFRGANIGNILNFTTTYPEAKLFKLEQNYRSTQNIVNAANSLIGKNKEQIPKEVYSKKHEGNKIELLSAYSDFEEGHIITGRIAEMRMLKNEEYKNFVILYRTNAQSRIFEEALRKRNVPYKIYGGLSFYQRKEVKDIIAYFRMVVNPHDEEALKRVINYPTRGIGNTTLGKISEAASLHQVSLWTVINNPLEYNLNINSGTAKKLEGFRELIAGFVEMNKDANAYQLGESLVRKTGLVTELYQDRTPEGMSRIQNVEELINSLYEFVSFRQEQGVQEVKMGDFLAEISLMTDQDSDKDGNADRVTMMTIHAAKGLEFKNVFIVGLEEELFPSSMSRDNMMQLEEERRLFYVALTRAEENCVLSYAKSRFHNGQTKMQAPSRFLQDIDTDYLKLPADLSFTSPSRFGRESYGAGAVSRMGGVSQTPEKIPAGQKNKPSYTEKRNLKRLSEVPGTTSASNTLNKSGDLTVGDTIKHERFGMGKVIAFEGEKENAKVTVDFDTFGRKHLLLKFAKYVIIK